MIPFPPFIPVHFFFQGVVICPYEHIAQERFMWCGCSACLESVVCILQEKRTNSSLLTMSSPDTRRAAVIGWIKKTTTLFPIFTDSQGNVCVTVRHFPNHRSAPCFLFCFADSAHCSCGQKAFPIVVGSVLYFTSLSPCRYLHEKLLIYSAATPVWLEQYCRRIIITVTPLLCCWREAGLFFLQQYYCT